MIFAQLDNSTNVTDILKVLENHFGLLEWGDQGSPGQPDAYFWVFRDDVRVAVDNLTSIEFQVKCATPDTSLLQEVLEVLAKEYHIDIYSEPELEAHE